MLSFLVLSVMIKPCQSGYVCEYATLILDKTMLIDRKSILDYALKILLNTGKQTGTFKFFAVMVAQMITI